MNVLIVNPIMYTSETEDIKRAKSIKDTMIYDLCLAFLELGHNVELFAAEPYKPVEDEEYPFPVIWGKCRFQRICKPHCFPYLSGLLQFVGIKKEKIDLIITSEIFSINTLNVVRKYCDKVIVWHELAKHNAMLNKLPSKIWYNFVVRVFMYDAFVVARSEKARLFIKKYCKHASNTVIEHGVNLDKFQPQRDKKDYFVVCSQLIPRKRIDGICEKYRDYLQITGKQTKLYIIGDGPNKGQLEKLCHDFDIQESVSFTGRLTHDQMMPLLSQAKALLINTEKDNSMISIIEAIAVGTPVVTTDIPHNATNIRNNKLGIVGSWSATELIEMSENNAYYVDNCLQYREHLSNKNKVNQFIELVGQKEV